LLQNKSGTLDSKELIRLAEVLWDTLYDPISSRPRLMTSLL